MELFPKYIPDYNREDAILSGVESRTSSPVRITRDESLKVILQAFTLAEKVPVMPAVLCQQPWTD